MEESYKMYKYYNLIIEPYVHIEIKKDKFLLYNTLNNEKIISSNLFILELLKRIIKKNASQRISNEDIKKNKLLEFICDLKKKVIGDLLIVDNPKDIPPIIQRRYIDNKYSRQYLKSGYHKVSILSMINEINLFFLSECESNCDVCSTAYKQVTHCYKYKNNEIYYKKYVDFIQPYLKINKLYSKINIITNDIENFNLINFMGEIKKSKVNKQLFVNIFNYKEKIIKNYFKEGLISGLNILINSSNNMEDIINSFQDKDVIKCQIKFIFLVENEDNIIYYNKMIKLYKIQNYQFLPYYNKNNDLFFQENIYLREDTIFNQAINMNQIIFNQEFNALNVGKIYIKMNGDLYTNLNQPKKGNYSSMNINELIFDEMLYSRSWKKLRKNVQPCNSCLLCNICPPISNYELFLKRNDLCQKNV